MDDLRQTGTALAVSQGLVRDGEADLYIWDYQPGTQVDCEIAVAEHWRYILLVSRKHLPAVRRSFPVEDANLVLKPVSKAALTIFLSEAIERWKGSERRRDPVGLRADRDELLQCLIQANLKLQEYDHDRTNFLARAIHDFRAPLTAVTGYCGLLTAGQLGPVNEEQREVLGRMQRSAKKLSRMAEAMFQLSIAPRTEVTLDLKEGDFSLCLREALDEITPAADEKQISIHVDVATPDVPVCFEHAKLEQVLVNLVDNACRFTPRGGNIEIKAYPYFWERRCVPRGASPPLDRRSRKGRLPNAFRVDIQNSGPSIPSSRLQSIFEEYTSYAGGVDRSGGGLGLAICRMILEQHNGSIWAENVPGGALFSFVLMYQGCKLLISEPATLALAAVR